VKEGPQHIPHHTLHHRDLCHCHHNLFFLNSTTKKVVPIDVLSHPEPKSATQAEGKHGSKKKKKKSEGGDGGALMLTNGETGDGADNDGEEEDEEEDYDPLGEEQAAQAAARAALKNTVIPAAGSEKKIERAGSNR
jgi:hypothetical protein